MMIKVIWNLVMNSQIMQVALGGAAALIGLGLFGWNRERAGRKKERRILREKEARQASERRQTRVKLEKHIVNDIDDPVGELHDKWTRD